MTEAASTAKKQQIGVPFRPGQSGNPKGRSKGSRNKLGEEFLQALHIDFSKNGVAAIEAVRAKKPDQYLKVIASILPKELNVTVNEFEELGDDELISRIRQLDATIRPFLDAAGTSSSDEGIGPKATH